MNCAILNCKGTLRVSHTYPVASEKFQRAICQECGTIHALATHASIVTARGEGAKAQAARAKKTCETPSLDLPC